MGIEFCEEFLDKRESHVETSECLVALYEALELVEGDLA